MDLCDPRAVRELLARHGFRFSKSKGQNFLTASWVPRRIVEESGIDNTCGALEVGPGVGPLTKELCAAAGAVTAVEVDGSLRPVLAETMAEADNLHLIFADVMKLDVGELVQKHLSGLRPVACANLPYYITSPILTRLLESEAFSQVTVMVQKEVAQRICARPGTADYSAFTVFCRYYADSKILFDVPPDCFLPRPKVTSSVLKLSVRGAPPCEIRDRDLFFRVVRAAFSQRRKTLTNGLASGFPELGKDRIRQILLRCGFSENVRGETLDLAQFAAVADAIAAETPGSG